MPLTYEQLHRRNIHYLYMSHLLLHLLCIAAVEDCFGHFLHLFQRENNLCYLYQLSKEEFPILHILLISFHLKMSRMNSLYLPLTYMSLCISLSRHLLIYISNMLKYPNSSKKIQEGRRNNLRCTSQLLIFLNFLKKIERYPQLDRISLFQSTVRV